MKTNQIILVQCGWCGAIKIRGGQYVSPPVRLPLIKSVTLVDMDGTETEHPVSHGICETCQVDVLRQSAILETANG